MTACWGDRWSAAKTTSGAWLAVIALSSCARSDRPPAQAVSVASVASSSTAVPSMTESSPTPPVAPASATVTIAVTAPATNPAPFTAPPPTPPVTSPHTVSALYRIPVAHVDRASWGDTHSAYPATDIFLACGAELVSPVDGTVLEVRRVDSYDPAVDNPATRGGRSVAILGHDGVRYYMAHFETIVEPLAPGDRVAAGQTLGQMGMTGRASACHVHFAISPPCPGKEWSVRRGVIWPYPYLDAWRDGEQRSPADEIAAWVADHPTACDEAMADPNAPDA